MSLATQATFHGIFLIALAVGALVSVVTLRRRHPSGRKLIAASGLSVLGAAVTVFSNAHLCDAGTPRNQWLILGPCLFAVLAFVGSPAWRRVLATVTFLGMLGLSCHFSELVHRPGWTGNTEEWSRAVRALGNPARLADDALPLVALPDADLPEAWLRDTAIWDSLRDVYDDMNLYRRDLHQAWHSALTGMYPYVTVPQDFWYPGGSPRDALRRVELRDRAVDPS